MREADAVVHTNVLEEYASKMNKKTGKVTERAPVRLLYDGSVHYDLLIYDYAHYIMVVFGYHNDAVLAID